RGVLPAAQAGFELRNGGGCGEDEEGLGDALQDGSRALRADLPPAVLPGAQRPPHPILRHAVEVAVDFGRLQELAPRPRFLELGAGHEDVVDAVDLTRPPWPGRRGHREAVLRVPQAHLLDDGVFPHAGGAGDDDEAWARERAQLFYEFIRLLVPSHPSRHQVLPSPAPLPKRHAPSTRPPLHYHSWPLLGF